MDAMGPGGGYTFTYTIFIAFLCVNQPLKIAGINYMKHVNSHQWTFSAACLIRASVIKMLIRGTFFMTLCVLEMQKIDILKIQKIRRY